ncbi:hypothetical protein BDF19DRAFT_321986 [Syncephalis fuscata]|nr:hypothetical protein BDF19DRAFT_321986 [Syncephalis fuscata]
MSARMYIFKSIYLYCCLHSYSYILFQIIKRLKYGEHNTHHIDIFIALKISWTLFIGLSLIPI